VKGFIRHQTARLIDVRRLTNKKAARAILGGLALTLAVIGVLVGSFAIELVAIVLAAIVYGPDLFALLPD
jgi:hypothetical protein